MPATVTRPEPPAVAPAAPAPRPPNPWANPRRAEIAVALAITALAVWLHAQFGGAVGALWRDEINSVNLASLPTFSETWRNLQFDSFPILWFAVLRGWTGIFGADNDGALRTLGLLLGVGMLAALWVNARVLRLRAPLLAVALLGVHPHFIRYGDSLRAYGLGMLLMLLTFAAVWRVVESATPRRVLLATVAAVLAVQSLYYNSVLLFAVCVGGAAAAALEREWKKGVILLGIGGVAAVSLVIYAPTIHQLHDWNFLVGYPVTLPWLWKKLSDVTGAPLPAGVWVWTAMVPAALAAGVRASRRADRDTRRALAFAGTTLVVAVFAYALFLKALNYFTQPWYYLSFLAITALCLDVLFTRAAGDRPGARWGRIGVAAAFALATVGPSYQDLQTRHTNVDRLAEALNPAVAPGDLVLCTRWETAITFARYYRGAAPVETLPPMADHRFHRYDLIKRQMMAPDPIAPVLAALENTLKTGHRVWVVGPTMFLAPGKTPPTLPPAEMTPQGWRGGPFYEVWTIQASHFLQSHATGGRTLPVAIAQPVSQFEDLPLSVVQGWRESVPTP